MPASSIRELSAFWVWRRGLHTHLVFFNTFSGSYFFYEKLVELLGAEPAEMQACADRIRSRLPERFSPAPERTCIGASCSDLAPERMLSAEQWRRVFLERASASEPRTFVFLGAARDRALAEAIIREDTRRTAPAAVAVHRRLPPGRPRRSDWTSGFECS